MTIQSKATIKATFETSDVPTQAQFADLIDSVNVPLAGDLTYASTLATDASLADVFRVTLTGNVTLSNPTNAIDGKAIVWEIKQDSTGSRTITLGDKFVIPSSATTPLAWSTAANKTDILAVRYHSASDKFLVVSMVPGYSL